MSGNGINGFVAMCRPYNFVHDIDAIYFKFRVYNWFYNDPGYSDEYRERNGYHFDGQIFYKRSN